MRSRAVALSPTGQSWAAATTEGLLLYSLEKGATFDPTNLTEGITPQVSNLSLMLTAHVCIEYQAITIASQAAHRPALGGFYGKPGCFL